MKEGGTTTTRFQLERYSGGGSDSTTAEDRVVDSSRIHFYKQLIGVDLFPNSISVYDNHSSSFYDRFGSSA